MYKLSTYILQLCYSDMATFKSKLAFKVHNIKINANFNKICVVWNNEFIRFLLKEMKTNNLASVSNLKDI